MSILTPRPTYAPFEYPEAHRFWELQQQSHWIHSEIAMSGDIQDWKETLTPAEKNVIGNILKGFTQSEIFIQEYWGGMVSNWFKKPEIQMMAACFSNMESVHAVSYAYLNDSLGLSDYAAFLSDPSTKAKIDRLITTKGKTKPEIARSLAIFSAFNEGVNLFSSFAVLLNFSRFNKLKGVGQIIAFSIKDECVTPDTEVLTPEGWKYISEIEEGITKVAQFNPETKEIDFVIPSRIVKKEYQGNIVHYNSEKLRIEQKLTENHDMLVGYDRNPGVFQKVKAIDFEPQTHRTIPVSGFKSNTTKKTLSDYERLLIAIQADGFISDRYTGSRSGTVPVTFSFSKQRKIKRLTDLLDRLTFSYSITPREGYGNKKDQLVFKVDVPISYPVYKTFEEWVKLEELDQNWCNEFLDELVKWDGSVKDGESDYYSSTIKSNVDIVQAIASFCGKFVTMYIQEDNRKETFSTVYRSRIHNMDVKRTGGVTKTLVPYDGLVYCVTVPTSAFVIRVNGAVSITGNCLHSEAGCWLFRQLVAEFPDIWTDELKKDLYDAARLTVELEDNFIDKVFELGSIEGLDPKDLKTFIRHRCNTKLQDIGLKSNWKNLDKESLKRMEWFDTMSVGVSQQDFFAGRVDSYSRGNKDWDSIF